ncbi:MAG: NADH:flavin oxidoreductase/NADH oxidase [Rhodanobacteraceae bacterium]
MDLFDQPVLGDLALRNRLIVSPMCEYSAVDGLPNDWHFVHLGSRAVGGAGIVFTEATAVSPEGRISPGDTGLWNDAQQSAWACIAQFVAQQGAMPGVQLAHAGRKGSTKVPWQGLKALAPGEGAWTPLAPSAIAFSGDYPLPAALDESGIAKVVADFRAAAQRARDAGFRLVEIHAAHGYLLHEFLSPLSNRRDDRYGGSLVNRARLVREVVAAVRAVWPAPRPLFVRVSATDWAPGGWDIEECVELARWLRDDGVDVIDASSGGLVPYAKVPSTPGFQVPFAARIRREARIATAAVGLITEAKQAQEIVARGDADFIVMARELLRDPYFPRRAAKELGVAITPPVQYGRAW